MLNPRKNLLTGAFVGAAVTLPLAALMYLGWQAAALPMVAFDLFESLSRVEQLGGLVTKGIDLMVGIFSRLEGVSTDVAAKSAEQIGAVLLFVLLGAVAGGVYQLSGEPAVESKPVNNRFKGVVFGVVAWLISLVFEIRPGDNILVNILWLGALYIFWGVALAWVLDMLTRTTLETESRSRRAFLLQFGGAALGVTLGAWGLGALLGRRSTSSVAGKAISTPAATTAVPTAGTSSASSAAAFVPAPGTRPEVTANKDFYRVDINVAGPLRLDEKTWKLDVSGLVDSPMSLSYADIRAMPHVEQNATLQCISNPVGGTLIGSTRWTGVRLRDILKLAKLKEGVVEIKFTCGDGYTESLPLQSALDERTLLAYAMNGEALTEGHGFPLRLWTPDRYGMKNPKWITSLEAIGTPYDGYWEVRGWDKEAIVKTTSVIDTIATESAQGDVVPVGGIAYSGARGISKVEVSVDGGEWQAATLKDPISPLTWRLWRLDWKSSKGHHQFRVRATNGQNALQTDKVADLHPDGASGYHSKSVDL
jgi:DMSO/TMAO reductase YedYZ molybdopterin-dependent catalytic subunit/uncharacterized membrane protein HdeD (DUF308 family)